MAAEVALVPAGAVAVDDQRRAAEPAVDGRVRGRDRVAGADHRVRRGFARGRRGSGGSGSSRRRSGAPLLIVEPVDHLVAEAMAPALGPQGIARLPVCAQNSDRQVDDPRQSLQHLEHVRSRDVGDERDARAPVQPAGRRRGRGRSGRSASVSGISGGRSHRAGLHLGPGRTGAGRSSARRWVNASSIGATTQRKWWAAIRPEAPALEDRKPVVAQHATQREAEDLPRLMRAGLVVPGGDRERLDALRDRLGVDREDPVRVVRRVSRHRERTHGGSTRHLCSRPPPPPPRRRPRRRRRAARRARSRCGSCRPRPDSAFPHRATSRRRAAEPVE